MKAKKGEMKKTPKLKEIDPKEIDKILNIKKASESLTLEKNEITDLVKKFTTYA